MGERNAYAQIRPAPVIVGPSMAETAPMVSTTARARSSPGAVQRPAIPHMIHSRMSSKNSSGSFSGLLMREFCRCTRG